MLSSHHPTTTNITTNIQNVVFYVESSSRELETLIELEAQEINRIGSEMTIIYDRLKSARSLTGREELTKMHAVKPTMRTGLKKRTVEVTTSTHTKDLKMSHGDINLNSCSNIGISISGNENNYSQSSPNTSTTPVTMPNTNNSFYSSRANETGSSFIRSASTARLGTPVNLEVPSSLSTTTSTPATPPPSSQSTSSFYNRSNSSINVPPPPPLSSTHVVVVDYGHNSSPPPPPPQNNMPPPPPPSSSSGVPPPPKSTPPPPPSSSSSGVPPPPPSGAGVPPPPMKMVSTPPPPPQNVEIPEDPTGGGRGDLLASIRAGKALRKVPPPNDAPKLPSKSEMSGGGSASTSSSGAGGGGGGDMMSQILAKRNKMMNK